MGIKYRINKNCLSIVVVNICLSSLIFAENENKKIITLNLQSAMDIAEKNSTEVKINKQDFQNYDGLHSLAYFGLGPQLSASGNVTYYPQTNQGLNSNQPSNTKSVSLEASQPITGMAQGAYKLAEISSKKSAATDDLNTAQIKARSDGAQAFIKAQQALSNMEIKKGDFEIAKQQFKDTEILFESGDENKTKIDLLQMKTKSVNAEIDFYNASNEFDNSLADLKAILSLDNNYTINFYHVDTSYWEKENNKIPNLAILLEQGKKTRKELKSYDKKIEAQNYILKQNTFEFLPQLNLFANYTNIYSSSDASSALGQPSDTFSYGIKLNWKIWDSGITSASRMETINAKEKLKINKEKSILDINKEVTTAYNNLKININILPQSILAAETAEESFKLSQIKYKTGNLSATDLILVQNTLTSAKINLSKLRSNIDIAWIQLQASTGNIPTATKQGGR